MSGSALAVRPVVHRAERIAFAAAVVGVGVLGAAVCLPGARRFALWQDEVASARVLAEPHPLAMLRHVAATESTPPLWYAAAWLVHRCGTGIQDVRLLSVVAVALAAAGTAVAARRVVPRPAALLAGGAVALGYQFDFHGRELRAYELAALLSVALAVAAVRGRRHELALVVAAGSLTHYFFLFSVAAVVVWRPRTARAVAPGLVPLALWSPALVRQLEQHRFGFIGPFRLHTVSTTYWTMFARGQPHGPILHEAGPLLVLAAVLAGGVVLARSSEEGRLCALLAIVPVALAALLWLGGLRIYDVRNLIVAGPFAAVCVVALLSRLPRPGAAACACGLAVLLALGYVRANRARPVAYDRIAAALVAEGWHAGEPIVVYGDVHALWGPLEWYLPRRPTLVLGRAPGAGSVFVVATRSTAALRRAVVVVDVRRTLVARVGGPVAGGVTFVVDTGR